MGITFDKAAMLLKARQSGVTFNETLTIGHLSLYIPPKRIARLASHYGVTIKPEDYAGRQYSERFIQEFLGAQAVRSMDYSDYQGSDIIHDLNEPVASELHEAFDVVIDGGSIEHIFDFVQVIRNYMQMVRVGGSLFIFTTANNHMGHGFYQFSPELFYRVFQPENGFEIRDVILQSHPYPGAELSSRTRCYSVVDPATAGSRVGLVNTNPVMIFVHAVKTETKPLFQVKPIQSDYTSLYANKDASRSHGQGDSLGIRIKRFIKKRLNGTPPTVAGLRKLRVYSLRNRRFYKPWDPL